MNGYQFQADAYRKYLEQHSDEENKESIERSIKVNEFLATCTKEDIVELYNTSAFNEITKAYAKKAMQNLDFKKKTNIAPNVVPRNGNKIPILKFSTSFLLIN